MAKEYKVIRGLRRAVETRLGKKRLEPVIDVLDKCKEANPAHRHAVEIVDRVRKQLEQIYGSGKLSFTTKLLWFRSCGRIVIYDRNAREALRQRKCEFDDGDYTAYHKSWREQFACESPAIRDACDSLPDAFTYSEFANLESRKEMLRVVRKEWFVERVFDQMLWWEGQPGARRARKD